MKHGDILSPLLFNFALEYAIRKVKNINLGPDMNGIQPVLAYAEDENFIKIEIRTMGKNAEVLINACKNIGLAAIIIY